MELLRAFPDRVVSRHELVADVERWSGQDQLLSGILGKGQRAIIGRFLGSVAKELGLANCELVKS